MTEDRLDLARLHAASFVNWAAVTESWGKKTVGSRLLLLAARRYLPHAPAGGSAPDGAPPLPEELPKEVRLAYQAPPEPGGDVSGAWGSFVDAALVAELETVSYGERPPLISELRAGLASASRQAGEGTELGRWFAERRSALPGSDLPDDAGYLPV